MVPHDNFEQKFSQYDYFCMKIGKQNLYKKTKLSKPAGKTATRRTPEKTEEANKKPQGSAVFPHGCQH